MRIVKFVHARFLICHDLSKEAEEFEEDFDEPIDTEESIDELTDELGLDDEEARWLKELLEED